MFAVRRTLPCGSDGFPQENGGVQPTRLTQMFAVGELGLPRWGKGDHEVVDEAPFKISFFASAKIFLKKLPNSVLFHQIKPSKSEFFEYFASYRVECLINSSVGKS